MVNRQTEIRKLPSAETFGLAKILDDSDSWIELLQIIPNENCDTPKYNTEHVRLIQTEASEKKSCSEILLDEWGISGRKRPTVGFLLELLIKADLYRAADYISVEILKGSSAPRPHNGPAAKIDTSLPEDPVCNVHNAYSDAKIINKQITCLQNNISLNSSEFQMECIPDFNMLLSSAQGVSISDSESSPNVETSADMITSGYIPDLAALDILPTPSDMLVASDTQMDQISQQSISSTQSYVVPNLTELNICDMPSEKFSINTDIPRYPYKELDTQTNNFSEISYRSCEGYMLGSGAFGTIYLARNMFNEPVAVKKLHNNNAESVSQFKNEIEIISQHKHKNLLRLLGYSIDGPAHCLIYEFMSGGCLKDRLQDNCNILKPEKRLGISIGCAEGIQYLHSVPIIHRDIKSDNILLNDMDEPKLSDFGLIKRAEAGSNSIQATTILGTTAYMSPEAHRGDISDKMDCFSFGVVILELITGLPPLDEQREGYDLVTHVEQHCDNNSGIDSLIDSRPGPWTELARKLYNVSTSCLLEKRKRPHMKEILEELKKILP